MGGCLFLESQVAQRARGLLLVGYVMYSACSEGAAHARALTSGTSIGGIRSSAASTRVLESNGALRSSVGSVECASAGCPADEKERAPSPEASGMCTLSWHVPFPCPGQLRPEEPAQSVLAKCPREDRF